MTHNTLRTAQVLWPSFMMAGLLEMLVFSVVDPATLDLGAWNPAPTTVYSLAFFVFWALVALAAAASQWMVGSGQGGPSSAEPVHARRRRARHNTAQHV